MKRNLFRLLTVSAALATLTTFATFESTSVCAQDKDPFAATSVDYAEWAPKLVDDSLAPSAKELRAVSDWADAAFAGKTFAPVGDGFVLTSVKQDFNSLHYDESCLGAPLCVGGAEAEDAGLGTHARSELTFAFEKPVARFSARVGIDRNATTATGGTVVFIVKTGDKEVARSPILTSTDDAFKFDVAFASPVSTLTLIADPTDDGPSCDQADWVDPVATAADGTIYRLNDVADVQLAPTVPFSFEYGGKSSRDLLPTWKFAFETDADDPLRSTASWLDPETGLKVVASIRKFAAFDAVDWVLTFENAGDNDSPLLENVRAADVDFDGCVDIKPTVVRTLKGDFCNEESWLPISYPLAKSGDKKTFAPVGGRSSNGAFPFWNVRQNADASDSAPSRGFLCAVGWSGQWAASFERTGAHRLNFAAGQETLSTILLPGEKIRTPRVLLKPWATDFDSAQAQFRRLLMFEYAPKRADGTPQNLRVVGQCFDRYYRKRAGWEKIDGQIAYARKLKEAGCDAHWFDAAWFPKGFPTGVGSWRSDLESFPNGVEELGETLEKIGLDFVLWFEPERVAADSDIANDYPQYVFGGKDGGLFKLNDPEARRFLTDLLIDRIRAFRVDVFRTDFNIDPLPFWTQNDAPNRKGMTEIRYVEGLYEYWDEIRATFPGLWIDDCASGGRRIDLETISRSIPLWRSDTCCQPGHPEWDQSQTLGLTTFLPLFSCCVWDPSPYTFRSGANPGVIVQYDFFNPNYDEELAEDVRLSVEEGKVYRKFWLGDFYPLTDATVGKGAIAAWQLNRPDLDAGLVYVFRQTESPYTGVEFVLRGIDPNATYRVDFKSGYSIDETQTMKGNELMQLQTPLKKKGTALVVQYRKID